MDFGAHVRSIQAICRAVSSSRSDHKGVSYGYFNVNMNSLDYIGQM